MLRDSEGGSRWVICPYCGKKNIKLLPETKIHALPLKCKNTHCRKNFIASTDETALI